MPRWNAEAIGAFTNIPRSERVARRRPRRAAKRLFAVRKYEAGDLAMRRLTAYCIVPMWIGAGFVDYICRRRTKIETTSGLKESLMHSLMMLEASPEFSPHSSSKSTPASWPG